MGSLFTKLPSESQLPPPPKVIRVPKKEITVIESKVPDDLLGLHDYVRSTAGLGPLKNNKRLENLARDWGVYLKNKEKCVIRHPLNSEQEKQRYLPGNIGQNIYVGHGYPTDPSSPKNVISAWYDECKDYTPPTGNIPNNFDAVGHFTQVMWKDAKQVGCARVECPQKMKASDGTEVDALGAVVVCNYDKGNVSGEFPTQVIYNRCPISLDQMPK